MQYISALPPPHWENHWPRSLVILGSTGSIGTSALEVVRLQKERFHVAGLAAARNVNLLAQQAKEFRPSCLAVLSDRERTALKELLPPDYTPHIFVGDRGYEDLARLDTASLVLSAQVGAAGLRATVAAAEAGKIIALANKESLVLAGSLIRRLAAGSKAVILPVDSEHNAIMQCLAGENPRFVSGITLTASGGPFLGKKTADLAQITPQAALRHPNWTMGAKITIDSATLMNKGLEVIEAHHLFGLPLQKISVVVHKESIIHSLVEYSDGSQLAHLGMPDMKIAIAHSLGWPHRLHTGVPRLELQKLASLTFTSPDADTFPCLRLARQAQEAGGGSPVVLNAANEVAVDAFLNGRLSFLGIANLVEQALSRHQGQAPISDLADVEEILTLDAATRNFCKKALETA